jgi:type I restriction enzyme M protein
MPEPNNNHTQRTELHRAIWNIANDLRGAVDGWDFKQYVLGMLFYRYISENLSQFINANQHKAGEINFEYANLTDEVAENARKSLVETKGFFILPSELFQNMRKQAPYDPDLNMTLARVFRNIEASSQGAESEKDFKGLFDDIDLNSNKLGNTVAERNKRLISLMNGVGEMKLGSYQDNHIDAFGDAYEYLMTMYASNAGKSGGEFFTPQYVSELLTRLTLVGKSEVNKVYDPALRLGFAAVEFRQDPGQGKRAPGFLWAGDQPDHLQPVPHQHVPARYWLQPVRYRIGRHTAQPPA